MNAYILITAFVQNAETLFVPYRLTALFVNPECVTLNITHHE